MSWLSTDWTYRKSITLARASGEVTSYQMKLLVGESSGATGEDVDCGGHCASDFDDLRFTTSDGTTLLDFWIESISGATPNQLATVWIEFDTIGTGDTTFYMYYGNASAVAASNIANTFSALGGDDFERGSDEDAVGGSWTIGSGDDAKISTDHAYGGTRSMRMGPSSGMCSAAISLTAATQEYEIRFRVWMEAALDKFTVLHGNGTKLIDFYVLQNKDIMYWNGSAKDTGDNITTDAWVECVVNNIDFTAGTYDLYFGGVLVQSGAGMVTNSGYANQVRLENNSSTAGENVYFDNYFVRNWRSTEPAWGSWGGEEIVVADLLNENCNDISDWTDGDNDTAVSEVDPAGQFRLDTNLGAAGDAAAYRYRTIASPPNQFTIEIKTYFDVLGALADTDYLYFTYGTATWKIRVNFASDGLFIYKTGAATTEVGTNIVKCNGTAAWQTFRFQVDKTAGESAATCEVFLDNVSQGAFDCDFEGAAKDGRIQFAQFGYATDNMVSHVDHIRIRTGLGPIYDGEIYSVSSAISAVDTFVAPTLGNVFIPAMSAIDTFVVPVFNMPRVVPALSTVDTFVAPIFNSSRIVPAISTVDAFVAPGTMFTIPIPRLFTFDSFLDVFLSGVTTKKYCRFPNTQGKHISLKFESDDDDGGFEIYYIRHKMYQTVNLSSEKKSPNTQGTHISLELKNTADEAFILEYVSEKMQRVTT